MYNLKLIRETYGDLCKQLCPMKCKLCILDALKDFDKELAALLKNYPRELREIGILSIEDAINFVRGTLET